VPVADGCTRSAYDARVLLTLYRHATLRVEIGGRRLLVDPMLDDVGRRPPVESTPNPRRNPLVALPVPAREIVREIDAVVVTHLHQDHFDATAARLLPRDVPVFCQPEDDPRLRELGLDPWPVEHSLEWGGLHLARTGGRHGTGEIEQLLAPVSGFVIDDLYLAGDTVWCDLVEQVIAEHAPRVAVVNGGAARFLEGDPIVMTRDDIREVVARVPTVVVTHLEAINHCLETRAEVRAAVPEAIVPADGETIDV
jgi:L-ascorbate metabolism protein UlaG (beta-lactamase superfamily)